jgi:hypothetical protein
VSELVCALPPQRKKTARLLPGGPQTSSRSDYLV